MSDKLTRQLPDNVMLALRLCVPFFSSIEKTDMRLILGGGTVLVSRWHHRGSGSF